MFSDISKGKKCTFSKMGSVDEVMKNDDNTFSHMSTEIQNGEKGGNFQYKQKQREYGELHEILTNVDMNNTGVGRGGEDTSMLNTYMVEGKAEHSKVKNGSDSLKNVPLLDEKNGKMMTSQGMHEMWNIGKNNREKEMRLRDSNNHVTVNASVHNCVHSKISVEEGGYKTLEESRKISNPVKTIENVKEILRNSHKYMMNNSSNLKTYQLNGIIENFYNETGTLFGNGADLKVVENGSGPGCKYMREDKLGALSMGQVNSDPVKVNRVNGDPVKVNRVNGDPVNVNRVNGDPVKVTQVNGDPVKVTQVNGDHVDIDRMNVDTNEANGIDISTLFGNMNSSLPLILNGISETLEHIMAVDKTKNKNKNKLIQVVQNVHMLMRSYYNIVLKCDSKLSFIVQKIRKLYKAYKKLNKISRISNKMNIRVDHSLHHLSPHAHNGSLESPVVSSTTTATDTKIGLCSDIPKRKNNTEDAIHKGEENTHLPCNNIGSLANGEGTGQKAFNIETALSNHENEIIRYGVNKREHCNYTSTDNFQSEKLQRFVGATHSEVPSEVLGEAYNVMELEPQSKHSVENSNHDGMDGGRDENGPHLGEPHLGEPHLGEPHLDESHLEESVKCDVILTPYQDGTIINDDSKRQMPSSSNFREKEDQHPPVAYKLSHSFVKSEDTCSYKNLTSIDSKSTALSNHKEDTGSFSITTEKKKHVDAKKKKKKAQTDQAAEEAEAEEAGEAAHNEQKKKKTKERKKTKKKNEQNKTKILNELNKLNSLFFFTFNHKGDIINYLHKEINSCISEFDAAYQLYISK
ncbi:hypothetical protein PGO_060430 [Plasmodium gonderi]|uniref:Uncharacterized protein n=1 Tax=Plasmodium gonderi TaxID=77519 RepID=A0A1Y1JBK0_PLAGO|nr:hypothetical protein PGO_060430 [Plasmodium gonderi]GAW79899.1 hypothetical protein PGO_060430 [Plasmodium gonderi]